MFCYYTWSNIIEQTNKGRTITKIFMRKVKNPLTVPYQHSLLLKSLLRARILYHCLCSHKCLSSSHLGSTRKKKKRWRHIPANEVFILQGSWVAHSKPEFQHQILSLLLCFRISHKGIFVLLQSHLHPLLSMP